MHRILSHAVLIQDLQIYQVALCIARNLCALLINITTQHSWASELVRSGEEFLTLYSTDYLNKYVLKLHLVMGWINNLFGLGSNINIFKWEVTKTIVVMIVTKIGSVQRTVCKSLILQVANRDVAQWSELAKRRAWCLQTCLCLRLHGIYSWMIEFCRFFYAESENVVIYFFLVQLSYL